MDEDIFLKSQKKQIENGFWAEDYKSVAILSIERTYNPEIIKKWFIVDLIINNDKILINWKKRYRTITDEEYRDKYN
ncbi:MAG: hypothetical protein GY849_17510 [Deltaproteobacteria bacterium]|nr:hypothetical protein [Deltaproteobacteria bacterium]